MPGFYAPANKAAAPSMTVGETTVTMIRDDAAFAVATPSIAIVSFGQPPGTAATRPAFVATREGGVWRLVSAQYAPIRAREQHMRLSGGADRPVEACCNSASAMCIVLDDGG